MGTQVPTTNIKIIDHAESGKRIRGMRTRAGISLKTLAIKLELSSAYVSDLEHGRRNWTANLFERSVKIITNNRERQ